VRPERLLALIIIVALVAALVAAIVLLEAPPEGSPPAAGGPTAPLEDARVVGVADGDTVTIEIDGRRDRLRYIGVDAPELADPDAGRPAECGATAATAANVALVGEGEITLERDASDRDRFGRLLRHPWLLRDGTWLLVTEALVADGSVEARSFPPDTLHDARLESAELAAIERGAGVWGGC
jgi:micrococcal nuclease